MTPACSTGWQPFSKGTQISLGVGDPAELVPKLDQARRVEVRRKADIDEFLRAHLDAVIDELRPQGEAVAAEANQAAREFVEKLGRYLALHGRVATLLAQSRGWTQRRT